MKKEIMNTDRSWMWQRLNEKGYLTEEFMQRVEEFLNSAFDDPQVAYLGQIRCPCSKCGNREFLSRMDAHIHILNNGFFGYTTKRVSPTISTEESSHNDSDSSKGYGDGSECESGLADITSVLKKPEQNIAETGWSGTSTQNLFDRSSWRDGVSGSPSKGRLYGYGRYSERVSGDLVASRFVEHDERIKELSKKLDDMHAATLKMQEEFLRRQDENKRMLKRALDENRKKEEEARKREAGLQEMVRKLIQDAGFTKHQYAGESSRDCKGRLYGYGRYSERVSGDLVASRFEEHDERIKELYKKLDDMHAATLKMQEEFLRRQDENKRMLKRALDENRKKEEEARKREAGLQEMVRKLIQDAVFTKHQYAGGSGPREQHDFDLNQQ
ncbi:hypothetical protein CDL12_14151 [Handroanthus impetiginosus]|uniref:Transposase-associated domain-containing protein n=1 Tax=Handroanthus impetiginosus TaxID=429701 RepID=A0A2G9H6U7_9LAMI|nr:hypothetical protein CDL12_14151 [Handroanthus impetiginosus]